ncbi:carbonic anhydrase [bacterium]|nr:carbonic anhydrase [bacterium]
MRETAMTWQGALEKLKAGNRRYIESRFKHPNKSVERREELLDGQNPFAVVLGCSDSRVPPEILFDRGQGDLFVIRVAGNVLDDIVLGSVEYAALHLDTPLVIVLGHSQCGAVAAACAGGELEGHLPFIAEALQPALVDLGDEPHAAERSNARYVAAQLESSGKRFAELATVGNLKILPAFFDLETGLVELLD